MYVLKANFGVVLFHHFKIAVCLCVHVCMYFNPRRACEGGGYSSWVCLCVSVCLSLLLYISLLERLFVPEWIASTQRATKVRKGDRDVYLEGIRSHKSK